MNRENAHIESFLDYYCSIEHAPGFAVLLTGAPGVGKSWLIGEYRKKLETLKQKSLYVSLYGISSLTDIENAFFEQLHPTLAQYGMGLSAKILKDSIKSTINLELKREKLSLNNGDDEIVPDFLANANKYLLIIDDLDRCYLTLPEIFGFFNFLLEHHGFKIILVANEEALKERQDNRHIQVLTYQKLKDKVVSRTFEVKPDFVAAFAHILDLLNHNESRELLEHHRRLIRELFIISSPANLRHLQHSLLDFDRLYKCLPEFSLKNHEFLKQLLTVFLIFSLEIRASSIQPSDLRGIRVKFHALLFACNLDHDQKSPQTYLLEKYRKFNVQDSIFSEEWWENFFSAAVLLPKEIERELMFCRFFFNEETPAIVRISQIWQLSDKDFANLMKKVLIEFNSKKHTETGQIKLTISFLLWASEHGLLRKSKGEILEEARKHIEDLCRNHLIECQKVLAQDEFESHSWQNIPFFTIEMPEFKIFGEFLNGIFEQSRKQAALSKTTQFLEMLRADPEGFCAMLSFSYSKEDISDQPVLSYLPAEEFIKTWFVLAPEKRLLLGQALRDRFFRVKKHRCVLHEVSWLNEVVVLMKNKKAALKGNLSDFIFSAIIEKFLEPSIEILEMLQMDRID
ncbi:MAG: P-loop NTPase fold protein [Candidatus Riflebacteria bacterium]